MRFMMICGGLINEGFLELYRIVQLESLIEGNRLIGLMKSNALRPVLYPNGFVCAERRIHAR